MSRLTVCLKAIKHANVKFCDVEFLGATMLMAKSTYCMLESPPMFMETRPQGKRGVWTLHMDTVINGRRRNLDFCGHELSS